MCAGRLLAGVERSVPSNADQPKFAPRSVAAGDEVDLLERVLADVADRQRAGLAVEGEAPRVAQAV